MMVKLPHSQHLMGYRIKGDRIKNGNRTRNDDRNKGNRIKK